MRHTTTTEAGVIDIDICPPLCPTSEKPFPMYWYAVVALFVDSGGI